MPMFSSIAIIRKHGCFLRSLQHNSSSFDFNTNILCLNVFNALTHLKRHDVFSHIFVLNVWMDYRFDVFRPLLCALITYQYNVYGNVGLLISCKGSELSVHDLIPLTYVGTVYLRL